MIEVLILITQLLHVGIHSINLVAGEVRKFSPDILALLPPGAYREAEHKESPNATAVELHSKIATAALLISERGDPADFTDAGEIRMSALKRELGFSISSAERDAALSTVTIAPPPPRTTPAAPASEPPAPAPAPETLDPAATEV